VSKRFVAALLRMAAAAWASCSEMMAGWAFSTITHSDAGRMLPFLRWTFQTP
jgi:hypothetical protein